MRAAVFFSFLSIGLIACGSPVDNTMNKMITPSGANYPMGPYGYAQGSIVGDLGFVGKKDPAGASGTADYSALPMEAISLASYYGDPNVKYVFMSGNAGWCKPCNDEQPLVKAAQEKYEPKGVKFLEAMNQGYDRATGAPATEDDINQWASRHQLHLAIASDPSDYIHQYADVAAFPLNMVIRTSDMQIVFMAVGEQDIDSIISKFAP